MARRGLRRGNEDLKAQGVVRQHRSCATKSPTEPGVSRELAIVRAARLSNLRYRLSFTIKEHESAVAGTENLTFDSKTAGYLPIDYRDGVLQAATLNGHAIPTQLENGHLNLPAIAGQKLSWKVRLAQPKGGGGALRQHF